MKQTIFFLLLFISSITFGQTKIPEQTTNCFGTDSVLSINGGGHYTGNICLIPGTLLTTSIIPFDTIPVKILVCNTSPYNGITIDVAYTDPIARAEQIHHSVNWIDGYAVREITLHYAGWYWVGTSDYYNSKDYTTYDVQYYLDNLKWRLPSTYIVWIVK